MLLDQETLARLYKKALDVASESSDAETKVGAVAYDPSCDGFISTGTNHFVNNAPTGLPSTRPNKYEFIVHAEQNMIFSAARWGNRLERLIVFCTLSPCQTCVRAMYQSGIRTVYFKDRHVTYNTEMKDILVTEDQVGDFTRIILTNHPNS